MAERLPFVQRSIEDGEVEDVRNKREVRKRSMRNGSR